MIKQFVLISFCTYTVCCLRLRAFGPKCRATNGQVWPRPQKEEKGNEVFTFSTDFQLKIENDCHLIQAAILRHFQIGNGTSEQLSSAASTRKSTVLTASTVGNVGTAGTVGTAGNVGAVGTAGTAGKKIKELQIKLLKPCEKYPYFGMDESYNLTVQETTVLAANSVWGILRGLETFDQLKYYSEDQKVYLLNSTKITDFPRYPHRGYLLDTSRHFISLRNIIRTLDAMEMNKMNVFHWHIVDDNSFPFESPTFPELSQKGAYHPSLVYSVADVKNVVENARLRGIRVVPELDVPGHTRSWGESHPELLTPCGDHLGPLNPIRNRTYEFIGKLLNDYRGLFPDKFCHFGGDEVEESCWKNNKEIKKYVKKHKIGNLNNYFMKNVMAVLEEGTVPIVWQEVLNNGVKMPKETFVQEWKGDGEVEKLLRLGRKVLFSSSWYLDQMQQDFNSYYVDPRYVGKINTRVNSTLLLNIQGGEACMWGEMIDDTNFLSRSWPRASAVAEVLWSADSGGRQPSGVCQRVEEHVCRMVRRGVPAQPASGPGYCFVPTTTHK